jgi:hypothetical protein
MKKLASVPGLELLERDDGTWVVVTAEGLQEFEDPTAALDAFNDGLRDLPVDKVTYHVEIADLTGWANEDEGLFPDASNGWAFVEAGWVPTEAADNPTSSSTIVESFGDYGAVVYLHRWGNEFAAYQSGLEGEDSGWMSIDATTLEDARKEILGMLDDLLDSEGLNFPRFMCLDNLPTAERYAAPDGAKLVQRRTSFWDYGEEYICELEVYVHDANGGQKWLVVDSETNQVIGEYDSLEALDDAVVYDEYEKLTYDVEEVDDDDE